MWPVLALPGLATLATLFLRFVFSPIVAQRSDAPLDGSRLSIWGRYILLWLSSAKTIFFGAGASCISIFANRNGMPTAHSGYVEKLVEFGLIGLILLGITLKLMLGGVNLNPFRNYKSLPFLIYMITLITLGMSGAELPFLLLGLASLINQDNEYQLHEAPTQSRQAWRHSHDFK